MKCTIDQIIAEIGNARKESDMADQIYKKVVDQYMEAEDTEPLEEALQVADSMKTFRSLYRECLFEMAAKIVMAALCEAWTEPAFLQKWEGTPFHYKRLQNALSQIALAVLPEGSRIFIYVSERDTWATPSLKVYCPVPGDPENRDTALLDAYVPYALSPSDDDGKRVFRLVEDEAAPASPDFPAFAEIMDACDSTYASKRERDKMLEDAISAARSLTAERSLGFTTLRNEIESRHFEF